MRAPARVEMPVATRRDYEPAGQRPSTIARMDAPEPSPPRQEPAYGADIMSARATTARVIASAVRTLDQAARADRAR